MKVFLQNIWSLIKVGKIPCRSTNCKAIILRRTASETGGYCMPCNRRKFEEFDKANRKDINLFENVMDPVEIIKIYHQPKDRSDPLMHYTPYPYPIERVYEQLNKSDIPKLIFYTINMLEAGEKDVAIDIAIELVSLFNLDFTAILEKLMSINEYYPAYLFRAARPSIRDNILKRLSDEESGDETLSRNQLFEALAWVGDKKVVRWYAEKSKKSFPHPSPITDHTKAAGWELDKESNRRNLYYSMCYNLEKQTKPPSHQIHPSFQSGNDHCRWCKKKLTNLIRLDLSDKRLSFIEWTKPYLTLGTCLRCVDYSDRYFAAIDENGDSIWSSYNNIEPEAPEWADELFEPLKNCLVLSCEPRSAYYGLNCWVPNLSQIGGFPSWIQHYDYQHCPSCHETMIFIGQFSGEDSWSGDGIYYVFLCSKCSLSATTYQQS